MPSITCPNCHKTFEIDNASYGEILQQVRTEEFNKEIDQKIKNMQENEKLTLEKVKLELRNANQGAISKKEQEIANLKHEIETIKLKNQSSLKDALSKVDEDKRKLEAKLTEQKYSKKLAEESLKKTYEENLRLERETYKKQLDDREEMIERLKDLKNRLSTKMIGETLELHCENEFNKIRATAFPNAYFEKDNDARTGSKGDYIFRDYDAQGNEIVSIMFEMKNEADATATKKKNEDFLKELDKDRNEKKCEYAVLVSLLEADSEFYNCGIVDMLHRYPKMYVIRPQFFIPMITLLRNAALNSMRYKNELKLIQQNNTDVTHFEEKLEEFKSGFARNYTLAARHFEKVIKEIDQSIKHLTKIKEGLLGTINHLRLANNKAQDVTIRKLTHKNPTMKDKFSQLKG